MIIAAAAPLLVGAGYLGAAVTAPALAASHHHHHHQQQQQQQQQQRRTTTCGWLRDGTGTGSALSAKPAHPVTEGQIATVQSISNAWTVCEAIGSGNTGKIWLDSAPGFCLADFGGHAIWEGCGGNNDEEWTTHPQSGGGYEIADDVPSPRLDICPTDGVGSQVIATGRTGCSVYHRTWLFSQAKKQTG
jgi:hypothetical protein